jgi:hypothetical protein
VRPRARRARAVLRDRRRGYGGPPIIGPLTGYDLLLVQQYGHYVLPPEGEMLRRIFPELH